MKETHLHKHLGTTITLGGSAVHRHGLPVTGELQSDILLHELLDDLLKDAEINAKWQSSQQMFKTQLERNLVHLANSFCNKLF